ncbi:MAG: trypsin-like peptidase domain-containing protein [Balneolales bacterium]
MIFRGSWVPPERIEVRYTDVTRSVDPIEALPGEERYSPSYIFTEVAQNVIPSVVYIETNITVDDRMPDHEDDHQFDNRFWERFLPQRRAQSIGSGVLITRDGYILTNHHVIDGADDHIHVVTHDKKQYQAQLVGSDPSTDIAVIKIDTDSARPMIVGNSDYVGIGDWVIAVGNPFRLRSTVTAGIVSAVGRNVDIINDRMRIESFIQTDAAINRGNSGGALVNSRGELIGINTAIASESGNYQGYGFAVPINIAMKIGKDVIEYGSVQRAFLGVEISSVNQQRARKLGLEEISGVEIRDLVPGGSAALAGLRKEDVVLEVNGYTVQEANQLQERIALVRPGESITMKVWRDNNEQTFGIQMLGIENEAIKQWATSEPQTQDNFELNPETEFGVVQQTFDSGFTVAELASPDDVSINELVVIRIQEDSKAYNSGLTEEDVIFELNGESVNNIDSFTTIWSNIKNKRATARLNVMRSGESVMIELNLN